MEGKHKVYTVYIYQKNGDVDYSKEILMGVNKQLATKAHTNKVKDNGQKKKLQ